MDDLCVVNFLQASRTDRPDRSGGETIVYVCDTFSDRCHKDLETWQPGESLGSDNSQI